jgi:hypothetical protein
MPCNGIYLLFENGERGHGHNRIVRIGNNKEPHRLPLRLKQHFHFEHKNLSIFRKSIGKAFLKKNKDPFLSKWSIEFPYKKSKEDSFLQEDIIYEKQVEEEVRKIIRDKFKFVVIEVRKKTDRISLEKCTPSELAGHFWPKS